MAVCVSDTCQPRTARSSARVAARPVTVERRGAPFAADDLHVGEVEGAEPDRQ